MYAVRIPTTGADYVKVYSVITAGSYTADVLLTATPPPPPDRGDRRLPRFACRRRFALGRYSWSPLSTTCGCIEDVAGTVLAQSAGADNFDQSIAAISGRPPATTATCV